MDYGPCFCLPILVELSQCLTIKRFFFFTVLFYYSFFLIKWQSSEILILILFFYFFVAGLFDDTHVWQRSSGRPVEQTVWGNTPEDFPTTYFLTSLFVWKSKNRNQGWSFSKCFKDWQCCKHDFIRLVSETVSVSFYIWAPLLCKCCKFAKTSWGELGELSFTP